MIENLIVGFGYPQLVILCDKFLELPNMHGNFIKACTVAAVFGNYNNSPKVASFGNFDTYSLPVLSMKVNITVLKFTKLLT